MSRVAFVADVHIGNPHVLGGPRVAPGVNRRGAEVLACLAAAAGVAEREGADCCVVAGDLFDTHHPSPQLIDLTMRALDKYRGRWWLLRGNHDAASEEPGDDALAPFRHLPNVDVVDADAVVDGMLLLPYRKGRPSEWLGPAVRAALSQHRGDVAGVCLHLGVRDAEMVKREPWMADADDAVDVDVLVGLCRQYGLRAAFAGNWHRHASWSAGGVDVVQIGALCPTGWDNYGPDGYGTVLLWDHARGADSRITRQEVAGPRFLYRIPSGPPRCGTPPYVQLTVPREQAATARAARDAAREAGTITDGRVLLEDDAGRRAEVREAARRITGATAAEEALGRYCAAYPMPHGVSAADVVRRSLEFLQAGRGS